MEILEELASPVVIGILMGGLYVVIALGLSLVFGVMKMINVAHGDLVILGSYMAFSALTYLGLDPLIWLLPSLPIFFLLGILIEKYLLNRGVKMSADAALIVAFGIALIIQNTAQILWTPQSRSLITDYTKTSFKVGSVYIPLVYILDFTAALIVMIGLLLVSEKDLSPPGNHSLFPGSRYGRADGYQSEGCTRSLLVSRWHWPRLLEYSSALPFPSRRKRVPHC